MNAKCRGTASEWFAEKDAIRSANTYATQRSEVDYHFQHAEVAGHGPLAPEFRRTRALGPNH